MLIYKKYIKPLRMFDNSDVSLSDCEVLKLYAMCNIPVVCINQGASLDMHSSLCMHGVIIYSNVLAACVTPINTFLNVRQNFLFFFNF